MDNQFSNNSSSNVSGTVSPVSTSPQMAEFKKPKLPIPKSAIIIGIVLFVALIGGIILFARESGPQRAVDVTERFESKPLDSRGIGQLAGDPTTDVGRAIGVNGQFTVNGGFVVAPSTQPSNPTAGQIYYDQTTNQLAFYDGKVFLNMLGTTTNISNVTNLFNSSNVTNLTSLTNVTNVSGGGGGSANAVELQGTTPGTSQTGNFNVSGTGVLGALTTPVVSSPGSLQVGSVGTLAISTGAAAGATSDISVISGASSTTAAGDVYIDTGSSIVAGTVIGTKNFETGLDNMEDGFGYNDVLAQSSAQAHSGTNSLSITVGLGPLSQPMWKVVDEEPYNGFAVIPGHQIAFSAWVRADTNSSTISARANWSANGFTGGSLIQQDIWDSDTDVAGSWKQLTGILTVPAGANFLLLEFTSDVSGSVGDVHYIDDITITDISASLAVAELKLGATNAQSITLGNTSQIGVTSIYGSGITMDGGLGNMNITGGALTQTTSNASHTTTTGALNLTAAATSTWRIANGSGAGGALNIQSGGGGGNGAGGDLNIQGGDGSGTGTGGNINITSGDSSTTASGNIIIDAGSGIIDGELVATKTFEGGLDGMEPWFSASVAQSSAQARSGTNSLAWTASNTFTGVIEDANDFLVPVTAGHQYYFSFWVRAATDPDTINSSIQFMGPGSTLTLSTVVDTTTGWAQVSGTGPAPAGSNYAIFRISSANSTAGNVHYLDDFEVIDLSSAAAFSAISIGAINAKDVTIGNVNQINATTIRGAGINLQAGQSNINITGGVINLTGAASSVLSTSAGSLTVTSAAAATWGVGMSATGNGENLTLKAGNGLNAGNTDGGDLVLQGGLANGTGAGGSVIVRSPTDTIDSFQIQNTAATSLFTADTTNMVITIAGDTTTFAKLSISNAHFASNQTNPPTIGTPTNCGTSPTAAVTAGSTDSAGSFTITTGTGGTSSSCDTVFTFDKTYAAAPKSIIVVGRGDAASALRQVYVSASSATTFTVNFATSAGGADSTPYNFSYWVVE